MTTAVDTQRCSVWARSVGVDPIGSAGSYRGYLLLPLPLPWPRDVGEMPEVLALSEILAGRDLRVQAVVGAGVGAITYTVDAGGDLVGHEVSDVSADSVGLALDRGGASVGAAKELLVCTHGRRDVCCGSLGTDLAAALAGAELPDDVRLWRTSHTGGHRFAPTFIVLPEATVWGFADVDLVMTVLSRRGDPAEVADRYRGCATLPSPQVQALEREVLREVGWGLLDSRRRGSIEGSLARLEVRGASGAAADVWEAEVTPGRLLPVPDCGRPIEEAKKSETEWKVSGLRRL